MTAAKGGPYGAASIRHRHLTQLVRTALSLPGPKLDTAPWSRLTSLGPIQELAPVAGEAAPEPGELSADARAEVERLRAIVAECLTALARRIDEALPPALARARREWDQVDELTIVDAPLQSALVDARRALTAAVLAGVQPQSAVALEGLIALEAACGLTALTEGRLSALIRLRVRTREDDLLPDGRPFLDLGAALAEAASAWS